ncbi:MAG: hypothetical protein COV59_05435 [Candidatus Magasanikbacteria bacterium CG11_big_fil_rev_8_21_14_0_20_39_34]|uniref:Glycoside hydrolase family 5 domain-containing protein n=1 Tax=Candidatus Magasanikbacteria bacterium CG11_big_fil_rev_8_21_14_0_20_39_34 TaxID=1974653 RepID=A0A2H0N3X5_9BACT|nr:MAG: hypothetical protein COV59_05435 [Candidatus Magasanikbacteria bacterium CG11_big_fil_rev_8_21_14_0_20_39_34]
MAMDSGRKEKHLINCMLLVLAFLLGVYIFVKVENTKDIQDEQKLLMYRPRDNFLQVNNGIFLKNKREPIYLTGVNLGQWLELEGYLWGMGDHNKQTYQVNYSQDDFDKAFSQILDPKILSQDQFIQSYRDNFVTEKDFLYLKNLGVNIVRIPFSAADFNSFFERQELREEDFTYLDNALRWCAQYQIYCLFDLHAAILPQSTFSHANSQGEATFWKNKDAVEKTILFWTALAHRYNDSAYLAGFDLLNEPQAPDISDLQKFYADAVFSLRKVGFEHLIFVQPNNVSLDIESILLNDKGIVYEPHYYGFGTKARSESEALFAQKEKYHVPVMIGEVGNWANDAWAKNSDIFVLYRFLREGIPIVYWNYKDMIDDNSKSFGLVRGNTGSLYQHFIQSLELGEKLDEHFNWDILFKSFQTEFPSDRPYVEDIIRGITPTSTIDVFGSFEEAKEALMAQSSTTPYRERSAQYIWDLSQEFLNCNGKTIQDCFGLK